MTRFVQHSLILALLSLTGCALFAPATSKLLNQNEPLDLQQIQDFQASSPVRRVVRLETSIVSALASDKRIRSLVWEELDESGLMSPEDRRRINQGGIRVGVSGGTLPWSLTSLMNGERSQTSQNRDSQMSGSHSASFGMQIAIPEGSPSIMELPREGNSLFVPAGEIAGLKQGGELENARCVLQMKAVEYGDGWVVIQFLPQIHHGAVSRRLSVAQGAEQLQVRQNIRPLYEQQFELKLHTHETVVIGYLAQDDWTAGRLLFQSDTLSSKTERLLALQLTQLEEVAGQKSMTINYSKY